MHTATSAVSNVTDNLAPLAETAEPPKFLVVEIANWQRPNFGLPANTVPLDKLVAKYESDPKRRAALQKARAQIAESLDPNQPKTLRTYRLERGYSQAALAADISTTQAQIARIESGKQDVQIGTLLRFAEALKLDPLDAIRAFLAQRNNQSA